jgi:hypothetical protein
MMILKRFSTLIQLTLIITAVMLMISTLGCSSIGLESENEKTLELLRGSGSDFSKIHAFDFYIYHPDQIGAETICAELARQGYSSTVREGALGGEWLCLVSVKMLPSLENLIQVESLIEEYIDITGGEYDGWETMIMPLD